MHGIHTTITLPETNSSGFSVPLLDDEFDPDRDEILDENEKMLMHAMLPAGDDTELDFADINI